MAVDQFLGMFVIANYGVCIYSYLALSGGIPLLLNACWTTFTLIGNTWTAFYLDRIGRRTCFLIGSVGCTVSAISLCTLSAQYLGTDNIPDLRAAVFFILYIFRWCFFMVATQDVYVAGSDPPQPPAVLAGGRGDWSQHLLPHFRSDTC